MKNIICIEISKYNQDELSKMNKDLNLKRLDLNNFKRLEAVKIWISLDTEELVSFTFIEGGEDVLYFGDDYKKMFLDIKPFELPKKLKFLSIDSILEKITKYGMESLTKDEKEFLDKESK
jgi:hypothetical protein